MGATDVAAKIRATALAVIEKQSFGEHYGFDCVMKIVPGPAGAAAVYTLVTSCPSPLLGRDPLAHFKVLAGANPDVEAIEEAVTNSIRILRSLVAQIRNPPKMPKLPHGVRAN